VNAELERKMLFSRYAVVAVILAAITASACGAQERGQRASTQPAAPATPSGEVTWSLLPEAPLRPRHGAHGLWVDSHFLVMGGRDTPACPPNVACEWPSRSALRDAASYSPTTGRWTRLAAAPVPLGEATTAVVGDVVYWWLPYGDGRRPAFLAYDVAGDRWRQLPIPRVVGDDRRLQLVAAGDLVVAYRSTHERGANHQDLVYDSALQAWRDLPRDPLATSFDRGMVWTGRELVLLALDLVDNPGAEEPSLYRAATFTFASRSWRPLPDSEVVGGWPTWVAVDDLVVNAAAGGADGGETNGWGRWYPYGGILDLSAASWSALPQPPADAWGYLSAVRAVVASDRVVLNGQGWLFDVPTRAWTIVPRPPGGTDDEQAVAIDDEQLYVWGGVTWDDDWSTSPTISNRRNPLSAAGWVAQ
jgi:hypothetical protein